MRSKEDSSSIEWIKTTGVDQRRLRWVLYICRQQTLQPLQTLQCSSTYEIICWFFLKCFVCLIHLCWLGSPTTVHSFMFSFAFELHYHLLESRTSDTSHQVAFTDMPTEKDERFPLIFFYCVRTYDHWGTGHLYPILSIYGLASTISASTAIVLICCSYRSAQLSTKQSKLGHFAKYFKR